MRRQGLANLYRPQNQTLVLVVALGLGTCLLMTLYLTLDAFPEVPGVLKQLQAAGMRTAILSNGSPRMLDAAVKGAKLEGLLDMLGQRISADVMPGHAFRRVTPTLDLSDEALGEVEPLLAVAVGLALPGARA